MNTDKAARIAFDMECGHRLPEITLFAYGNYLERGRGLIHIFPDENSHDKFSFDYSTIGQTDEYMVDITQYDPEKELLILMARPDGHYHQFTYSFLDPTQRPKYIYEMKKMFP